MEYHHPHPQPHPYEYEMAPIHHHQVRHIVHHPPPPPPPTAAIAGANSDIHTLFISGLPDDVKAREIHNLFRRRPGFDTCLLEYTGRGNQVVAFATFFNHQSALAAMAELNGVTFDPATEATLHIELARSNSRRRPRGDGGYDIIDKRAKVKTDGESTWNNDGNGGYDEPSGTENDNSSKKSAAAQSGDVKSNQGTAQAAPNGQSEKPSSDGISPCSTLFIANLSPSCTEEELKQILTEYHGFLVLKMQRKGGKPVAFADFLDVDSSTEAKQKLLGSSQGSADDEGLYLEYAKSKMRKT